VAVIDCTPGANERMAEHCACPAMRLPVQPGNVTTPVALDGETIAVKVTFCPEIDGFGLQENVTAVEFLLTV
jgi:hypothetical protein